MHASVLAAPTALILLLSACSSGEPASVPSTNEVQTSGASVQQFASVIAESRGDVDDWLADWHEATCSTLATESGDPTCQALLLGGGLTAETAKLKIEGATKPGVPAYIGEPPEEIAIIRGATEKVAVAAADAGEALPDDCSADSECVKKVFAFVTAMEDLQSKYDAWEPYM